MLFTKPLMPRTAISLGWGPTPSDELTLLGGKQIGGSAIEASKIAGHSDLEMTSEYTFVAAERQNELTRKIQEKLLDAAKNLEGNATPAPLSPPATEVPPGLADVAPASTLVQ